MYYRCGRGIVPPGGIRVAEIQKRGQSKLTLQLTSFVCCARDESRTHTSQLTLAPETSASTISPPAQQIGMQIYEFFLNFQWYYSNPNILMKYLSQVPWQSVCQCYQIPVRSLLTCTHHRGNNAWTGADEFPENNKGEPWFSTLLAGVISDTFAVSHWNWALCERKATIGICQDPLSKRPLGKGLITQSIKIQTITATSTCQEGRNSHWKSKVRNRWQRINM